MKKVLICFLALVSVLNVAAQKGKKITTVVKTPAPILKNLLDSFSYMAGYNVAANMKGQGITEINTVLMQKGIDDYFKSRTPQCSPEIGNKSLQRQLEIFSKNKADAEKKVADAEKSKGITYLQNNKKRNGVITLPDGLQYEIIKAGDPAANKPKAIDTVVVNYSGTLIDGKEFDNSYKRGQPAVFALNRVISGWTEILQLMTPGSHWKVYIPAELGYADNPPPGAGIYAGAVLVFDISLEGIKPAVEKDK